MEQKLLEKCEEAFDLAYNIYMLTEKKNVKKYAERMEKTCRVYFE